MKKIGIIILCLVLAGCITTAAKMNDLRLGMTKAQVIAVMGTPSSTKAKSGVEILEYYLKPDTHRLGIWEQYWITLENGKVVQYGKAGDF